MRDLIGRMEVVDDTAASALRVIAHFDSMVEDRASVPALQRAAAALAGCPAGTHDASTGMSRRVDPQGRIVSVPLRPQWHRLTVDEGRAWSAWLERDDAPGPLDDLILERLVRALRVGGHATVDDLAITVAVRVACDPDVTDRERTRALGVLGLSGRVTVIAAEASAGALGARRVAEIDGRTAVLVPSGERLPVVWPAGSAVVEAVDAAAGWRRARLALGFAGAMGPSGTEPLSYESLGGLAPLAEQVSAAWAGSVPDVAALRDCAADHPWVPSTLYAVVGAASARQAAVSLGVHHSTLQERVAWLEQRLGYSLHEPAGRHRASLALSLWLVSAATW